MLCSASRTIADSQVTHHMPVGHRQLEIAVALSAPYLAHPNAPVASGTFVTAIAIKRRSPLIVGNGDVERFIAVRAGVTGFHSSQPLQINLYVNSPPHSAATVGAGAPERGKFIQRYSTVEELCLTVKEPSAPRMIPSPWTLLESPFAVA